ncbi:hypothetical protein GCM10023063_17290 [Arthrobacter methylotrophus]|uniref:Uncharacterized protein n=1 Tax=Arthrobacter methylotrophus TaxID=121291 RepID=A0ABV5UNP9_9MICC
MANLHFPGPASCTSYADASAPALTDPPELDYKFFSPEFLDELEEHYRSLAVGHIPA